MFRRTRIPYEHRHALAPSHQRSRQGVDHRRHAKGEWLCLRLHHVPRIPIGIRNCGDEMTHPRRGQLEANPGDGNRTDRYTPRPMVGSLGHIAFMQSLLMEDR